MTYRIHMIEPLGRGGIFQHALALSTELSHVGADVVLHTATDLEREAPGVPMCLCFRWHRKSPRRRVRQLRTTVHVVGRTFPHLFNAINRNDVVHIQGFFGLTPELISIARARSATVISSPHNTFVRTGSAGGGRALEQTLKRADRILVYSKADRETLIAHSDVGHVPLVQWTRPVRPERVRYWRQRLSPQNEPLALLAGQVRADKNPDLFVVAMACLESWSGAIVGEDLGAGPRTDELIRATGAPVTTIYGYLDLDDFMALVAAADVVVAPYGVASQSGVLVLASQLGVPTAVTATGGLSELASAVARSATPLAIRDAILAARKAGPANRVDRDVGAKYLKEYKMARDRRNGRDFLNAHS